MQITRRQALKQGALAGVASSLVGFTPAHAAENPATFNVLLDEPIATIQPGIYGQFLEHIGGVVHDGVWVGPDSKIANTSGIRQSLIDHVRRLGPTVVRWPGGCFADKYHWRDGIGPAHKRPKRFARWREDSDPNQFGTHEFMEFCRLTKVQPYFAANVGTGTVEEFQQWVEYCNAPSGKTTLADERASNGQADPFKVRYWGVGNESWGCGGKFTPEDYCTEYRKFTDWLPNYGVEPYLIAAGPNGNDHNWTRRFFKKWVDYARAPLHAWAAHYYCGTTGHALTFDENQWYEMLFRANDIGNLIGDQWRIMNEFDPDHKVKLIIDEWGTWHPPGTETNPAHLYEQMGTLRDALVAALTLDTFNRHADKVHMANIAQMVNCLHSLFLADGDRFVTTPTFHVFEMYRPHQNGMSLRTDMESPDVSFKLGDKAERIWKLAGSASRTGKAVTVTLVHAEAAAPAEVVVRLHSGKATNVIRTVLTHKELNAHNTFDRPETVTPRQEATQLSGAEFTCIVPPASVTRLDLTLE